MTIVHHTESTPAPWVEARWNVGVSDYEGFVTLGVTYWDYAWCVRWLNNPPMAKRIPWEYRLDDLETWKEVPLG